MIRANAFGSMRGLLIPKPPTKRKSSQRPTSEAQFWNDEWPEAYGPPRNPRAPSGRQSLGAERCFPSPHPDPLPQGEGTANLAQRKAGGSGLCSGQSKLHPLPEAEGRDEGNFAKHSLRFKPILGIVEVQAGRLPK